MAIFFFATSFSLSNEDQGLPFAFADMDHFVMVALEHKPRRTS